MRAVWNEETSKWWFCAVNIAEALTNTKNPRVYWATIKRRNPELIAICKQLKLSARDGKSYLTDVIDDDGVNMLVAVIPSKIFELLQNALTDKIKDRELFMKGIDYSYYYEEE